MIVFDGDSVGCCDYPEMVANYYHKQFVNLAAYQSTTRELRHRLHEIPAEANWYVCNIGQWSATHQEYQPFKYDLEYIVRHLHKTGKRVCLITPPPSIPQTEWTAKVVRDTARLFNTVLVDIHQRLKGADLSYFEPHTVSCHFNRKGSEFVLKEVIASSTFYKGLA